LTDGRAGRVEQLGNRKSHPEPPQCGHPSGAASSERRFGPNALAR